MLETYTVNVFTLEEYSAYFGCFRENSKQLKPEETYKLYANTASKANQTILSLMDENKRLRIEISELRKLVNESID